MMPAKEGCSVSTTLVDTSASPRVPSSTLVRRAIRYRWQTLPLLSLPSLLSHQASLCPRGCFKVARGLLSPAAPSAVQPGSLQMNRTSAEVRSAVHPFSPRPATRQYKAKYDTFKIFSFCFFISVISVLLLLHPARCRRMCLNVSWPTKVFDN